MDFNTFSLKSNPWDQVEERRYGNTKCLLSLATEFGYKFDQPCDAESQSSAAENYDSIKMLSLMSDIRKAEDALYELNRQIDRTLHDKETFDLTSLSKLESRLTQLASLSSHLGQIVENKSVITTRLQQPYSGENLLIDASLHKYVVEFFSVISRLLSDLSSLLNTISWTSEHSKDFNVSTDKSIMKMNAAFESLKSLVEKLHNLRNTVTSLTRSCS